MAGVPLSERFEFTMEDSWLVTDHLQLGTDDAALYWRPSERRDGNTPKLQQVMGCSRWTAWDGSARVIQGNVVGGLAVGLGRWNGG